VSASSQRRVIDGVLFGYLQFVLDGAVRLLTIPFFLGVLGPQLMGLRAAVLELVGYLQVANPGTAQSMQAIVEKDCRRGLDRLSPRCADRRAHARRGAERDPLYTCLRRCDCRDTARCASLVSAGGLAKASEPSTVLHGDAVDDCRDMASPRSLVRHSSTSCGDTLRRSLTSVCRALRCCRVYP